MKKYSGWRRQYPYYKIQVWDEKIQVWRDRQAKFFSVDAAAHYIATNCIGKNARIIVVEENMRKPLDKFK